MTFLSPLPAIIAAAIAVPALLVLYFLKLRRRPLRVSSTLLWEEAVRDLQVNVPLRMLRFSWLLVLQLLILTLFLLALARPALRVQGETPPRVVLLIDRSASMSARDGTDGRTRLEDARAAAREFLDELGRQASSPAVAVVGFGAQPAALTGLSDDLGAARAAVESITPTDQPGDLAAALRLAGAIAAADADERIARSGALVVLFSDGGFAEDEGYVLPGAEFRFRRIGGEAGAGHDNVGLVALAARRDWDDPGVVRLFARLQNAGDAEVAVPLVVTFGDAEVERRTVVVPGRSAASPDGEPKPGEAAVTVLLNTREAGVAALRLERPDLLLADNAAALMIAPATKPRIVVVVPDPPVTPEGEAPPVDPAWIITDVIEAMELPMRVRRASAFNAADPGADLIIFDRVRPRTLPNVPTISFGAGLPAEGLDAGAPREEGTYVVSWERSHPILRHVSMDNVFISGPLALPAADPGSGVVELARGAAGPLMLLDDRSAVRRLVVGFELARSNWPLQYGFSIFLASAIDHLTLRAEDRAARAFTTAEPVRLEGMSGEVVLDGPERLATPAGRDSGVANFGRLERVGVYRVTTPAGSQGFVAVNLLDPVESALRVRDSLRIAGERVEASGPGEGPRELWPYFVAAALVLLAVEWFLNAWLMRV